MTDERRPDDAPDAPAADPVARWRATTRAKALKSAPERRDPFATSSGIEIADLYTAADLDALGFDPDRDLGLPGRAAVHPRRPADDVPEPPLDDAPVRRLRDGRGDERALPLPPRPGPDRALGRLRPADPDGLRLGRARGGRARSAGSASRSAASRTWRSCLRGLPLGEVSTSMTINSTAPILLALYVAAAENQGVPRDRIAGTTQNDILKEYIARGTWIYPPAAVDAPRDRHLRVRARGSCRAGTRSRSPATTCARPGRRRPRSSPSRWPTRSPTARRPSRAGSRSTTFAPAPELLLRRLVGAVRGGRQVPGGPADVGPDHARSVRRIERTFDGVPVPRPDRRLQPDRPVDRQQRRPDDGPGARGDPRRRPEPPHERSRRGARPADRGVGPPRPPDPADPRLRERRDRDARSARGLLLRRVA